MKSLITLQAVLLGAGLCLPPSPSFAAETNSATAPTPNPQPATAEIVPAADPSTAPKLPYGVEDVVKLSRAQISEDVVLNYIQNTGTIYSLNPQDIVYLKSQGVSDRVLNAMLDQRRRVTEVAAQAAPAPAAPAVPNAPGVPDAATAPAAPDYSQVAPQATAPPPSTVYVVPGPTASYPYYYPYYGYYGGYGYSYPYYRGYYGPFVSFGFRFGGHGHSHGGWHHH